MDHLPYLTTFSSILDRQQAYGAHEAQARELHGAILFTDFARFTPLTEGLAREGPVGAEKLSEILNWHYRVLTDEIAACGGDTLIFAGDALIVLFAAEPDGLESAAHRAAACGLALQAQLGQGVPPHGIRLGLRICMGVGRLWAYCVGGIGGRWMTLVGGQALDETFAVDQHDAPGKVVISRSAWQLLSTLDGQATADPLPGGGAFAARQLTAQTSDRPGPIPDSLYANPDVAALVIPLLRERSQGIQAELLAEFRDVTVVFVRLPDVDTGDPTQLERLHLAATTAQQMVQRLGGTLYQMLRDDKGCVLVLAFGLPGQAHDDNATRAIEAILALTGQLRHAGIASEAGVATGVVFCGAYGGHTRRNFGILGPPMNRAARLMQIAAGGILADAATAQRSWRWVDYQDHPPVRVKGVDMPVTVHVPMQRHQGGTVRHLAASQPMIGRRSEATILSDRIRALRDHGQGGAVFIEGEAGLGKSTLLRGALELATELGLPQVSGAADSIETNTAFLALRPVIASLLQIDPQTPPTGGQAMAALRHQLARLPARQRELAPLLNAVLPLDLPDNSLTAQMSGTIRAANLTEMLLALVADYARHDPLLLALEDLHWMDDASLQFCARVVESVPNVLLLATMRPLAPTPPALLQLTEGARRTKLSIDKLGPHEIVELVRRRLGAQTIPAVVKELILAKAEGNPFFGEELALTLLGSGAIVIEGGHCLVATGKDIFALELPGTVRGVITSRIDQLEPTAQVVLKAASVLGCTVELPVLQAVIAALRGKVDVTESITRLKAAELLIGESDSTSSITFRHALIQETTYNLLPFAVRKPMHAAAADYLEREHAQDLSGWSARLGHHWLHADRPEKALHYLGDAGRQALEAYANRAAVGYFSEAIKLDEQVRGPLARDARRASWHRQLAEGHYSLIQWNQARHHYEQAISLSGFAAPRFGARTLVEVFKHVAGRFAPRLVHGDPAELPAAMHAAGIEALRACDNLQVVYLWQGKALSLAHTVFEGANIAARTGASAEAAFARAMLGYLLALTGLRGVAERDLRAAVRMADDAGQLLQQVSTKMYLGMTLSMLGRPREAMPFLSKADELVSQLGAGLWKHRGKYMLAEPHLMLGRLDDAADLFADCATISMSVEPPITGFANAMRALCWIRKGQVDEGIDLIHGPTGICLVRDNPIGLQLYNTLGSLAEGHLWRSEWRQAMQAAQEAVTIPERGPDANSFFTGYNGHAAVTRVFLCLLEWRTRQVAGHEELPAENDLWSLAERSLTNFRKGARTFPGSQPSLLLLEGWAQALRKRPQRAQRFWQACIESATRADTPYELACAYYELGRQASVRATREQHLERARSLFRGIDMPLYAQRCAEPDSTLHILRTGS